MDTDKQRRTYKGILIKLQATLEGGDVIHDLEDIPSGVTTLSIIAGIINNSLQAIEAWESIEAWEAHESKEAWESTVAIQARRIHRKILEEE